MRYQFLALVAFALTSSISNAEILEYRVTGVIDKVTAGTQCSGFITVGEGYEATIFVDTNYPVLLDLTDATRDWKFWEYREAFHVQFESGNTISGVPGTDPESGRIEQLLNLGISRSIVSTTFQNDAANDFQLSTQPNEPRLSMVQFNLVEKEAPFALAADVLGVLPPLEEFDNANVRFDIFDPPACGTNYLGNILTYEIVSSTISCSGFSSPMATHPVTAKKNRVLPLKMELHDGENVEKTDIQLTAPPVVQVMLGTADINAASVDVSNLALSAGAGSEGNQFDFTDDGIWQFNLKSKNYTGPGVYWVTAVSGDPSEYTIDPSCVTSFIIK